MGYQEQNSQNLEKVLAEQIETEYLQREIPYEQSNQVVMLGEHNPDDLEKIRKQVGDWNHAGRIVIRVDKTNQLLRVKVVPKESQTSERFQLEEAIRQAIQGMTIKEVKGIKNWPVQFNWL